MVHVERDGGSFPCFSLLSGGGGLSLMRCVNHSGNAVNHGSCVTAAFFGWRLVGLLGPTVSHHGVVIW